MNFSRPLTAALLLLSAASLFGVSDWPGFRGPSGLATVSADDAKNLPADFDGATGKNILWKSAIVLPGESSPIVTANKVFLSGASAEKRTLFCYDGDTGKILWQQDIKATGKNPGDPDSEPLPAGYACPTPCTDGKRVAALYATGDLAAFDLDGKSLWSINIGQFEGGYGVASSPIVVGNNIILQFDFGFSPNEFASFIEAIDFATGKIVWKTKRPNYGSWTSPILITAHDKKQIITIADPWVAAYDPDTGAELWKASCMGADPAPSATAADGIVYTTVARNGLTALKTDGKGDVTKTHIAWKNEDDDFPEVPSPVTNGKQVFVALDSTGIFVAFDATKGKKLWEVDCDTEFRSSPTLIGDQIWIFDRKGVMHRITATAEKGKQLGTANLGEDTDAQPAYVGGRIYIRGKKNLYCIGAK